MRLSSFTERLDDRLRIDDFTEVDASANGLQVGPPEMGVTHAAFAVDAAAGTIERAVEAGADVLVVHHGVIWGDLERVTGRAYGRIAPLVKNDVALYVSHLPLDSHPELGNAAGIADLLGLAEREPFGYLGGPEPLGQRGRVDDPLSSDDFGRRLEAELDTGGQGVRVLDFGPDAIEEVAVLTGAGADALDEAIEAGADAFVTGEGKGRLYHEAREAGITVFLCGHYATETFGVERLQGLAEDWGLETTFVDCPTGL